MKKPLQKRVKDASKRDKKRRVAREVASVNSVLARMFRSDDPGAVSVDEFLGALGKIIRSKKGRKT